MLATNYVQKLFETCGRDQELFSNRLTEQLVRLTTFTGQNYEIIIEAIYKDKIFVYTYIPEHFRNGYKEPVCWRALTASEASQFFENPYMKSIILWVVKEEVDALINNQASDEKTTQNFDSNPTCQFIGPMIIQHQYINMEIVQKKINNINTANSEENQPADKNFKDNDSKNTSRTETQVVTNDIYKIAFTPEEIAQRMQVIESETAKLRMQRIKKEVDERMAALCQLRPKKVIQRTTVIKNLYEAEKPLYAALKINQKPLETILRQDRKLREKKKSAKIRADLPS